jgi:hypothetical protein
VIKSTNGAAFSPARRKDGALEYRAELEFNNNGETRTNDNQISDCNRDDPFPRRRLIIAMILFCVAEILLYCNVLMEKRAF